MTDIVALQKEVAYLKDILTHTQKQLDHANVTIKSQENEIVNLRASLLSSRSSENKSIISPRPSSPEPTDDKRTRTKSVYLSDAVSFASSDSHKESAPIHMAPTVKEKRRSKSVHLMEPIHFDSAGNSTGGGNTSENRKSRSKTELTSSGNLRESGDSLTNSPAPSPSKTKMLRRQSIKLFTLGTLGKFRKSMTDLMMEQPNVDTTTIIGSEKATNATNLYALLKIRPSYTNLMDRKIIFNFFNDEISSPPEVDTSEKKVKSSPLPMITPKLAGYRVEVSAGRTRNDTHWRSKIEIERMEKLENYYAIYFLGNKHSNFIGFVKSDIPVIVSVLDEPENASKTSKSSEKFLRAILWTPQKEYKLFLETSAHFMQNRTGQLKKKNVVKLVFPLVKLTDVKIQRLHSMEIYSDLTAYEQHSKVANIKAGVLYVKDKQTEEDEIFGNVSGSPDFEEFLELLGDSVTLKGFTGFRGGLDVNNNTTGEKSVYTSWSGIEFMFHVTTLLPYYPLDTQHIERKRHLGNDIVNIVFKEGDTPFNPSIIRSTFTQVFLVVEKVKPTEEGAQPHYRVAVASKNGIPPFGPVLRPNFSSLDKAKFRDMLFTKMCNAEMAALDSPVFEEKMTRTRTTLLTSIVKKYLKPDDPPHPHTPKKGLKKSPSTPSLFNL